MSVQTLSSGIRLKKTEGIDIFYIKITNFCTESIKIQKQFRLAAGPLPGVALGGEQPPAARCAGAKMRNFGVRFSLIQTLVPFY